MAATTRNFGKWIGAGVVLVAALVSAAPARATCAGPGCGDEALIGGIEVILLLVPGDVGVAVPTSGLSAARVVVGWSVQIPLERDLRHRLVPSLDLLTSGGVSVRGRIGYRYARGHLFGGAGFDFDGSAPTVSPELGVRSARYDDDFQLSAHLLARAEIDPGSGHVRGATFLLGWNLL